MQDPEGKYGNQIGRRPIVLELNIRAKLVMKLGLLLPLVICHEDFNQEAASADHHSEQRKDKTE